MNITILANQDIASNYALNMLLPMLAKHKVTVFLSAQIGHSEKKPEPLLLLKTFEQTFFDKLFSNPVTNRKEGKLRYQSFDSLSKYLCSPVAMLNNINSAEGIEKLRHTKPDLIISIRYGLILKDAAITIPRFGVINLHSGLLPAYRGVMATFWSMLNGEEDIGCTLHYIEDSQIDSGRIIATTGLKVDKKRSYLWHVLTLYEQGVTAIASSVELIDAEEVIASSAQASGGEYYSFPTMQNLQDFESLGLVLFNESEIFQIFNSDA